MTQLSARQIYDWIPAIHRLRDHENGEPLKALIEILAEQAQVMEQDITTLYDDWFIETCSEWLVPYIGEQLGVRHLREGLDENLPFSRRAIVANTLAYRRRKGTPSVLEQLAYDTSGYRAHVLEFFSRLDTTQHVNHVRPEAVRTPDLRDTNKLELIGGAFEPAYKTVDVRSVGNERRAAIRGKENISNVGLFLWRLQSYWLPQAELVSRPAAGQWIIHPGGFDMPLFNPPQTETDISSISEEHHLPVPLRARPLYDELEARRAALARGEQPEVQFFDAANDREVVALRLDGVAIPPEEILICDLSDWHQPADTLPYTRSEPGGTETIVDMAISVALDPVLGRISLPPARESASPLLSYAFGFSTDIGGGPYSRQAYFNSLDDRQIDWQIGVSSELTPIANEVVGTLVEALEAWKLQPAGTVGLMTVMHSGRFEESLSGANKIDIPAGSRLIILAADWPLLPVIDGLPGQQQRQIARINASNLRPTIIGDIEIEGLNSDGEIPGELFIDGFYIEGNCTVLSGDLGKLTLSNSTIQSPAPALVVDSDNTALALHIHDGITGSLQIVADILSLNLTSSIVLAADNDSAAITANDTAVTLCESTIVGLTEVQEVNASNCIFTGTLSAERTQIGCIRYSFLPVDSTAPKRYLCQPEFTLQDSDPSQASAEIARLQPAFTSLDIQDPGFAQLNLNIADEILFGADNGSEMGAFNRVQHAARMANLRSILQDYLRFGLQAGFFFET